MTFPVPLGLSEPGSGDPAWVELKDLLRNGPCSFLMGYENSTFSPSLQSCYSLEQRHLGENSCRNNFPSFFTFWKGRDSCSVPKSRDSTTACLEPDPAPVKISEKIPTGLNRQLKEAASGSSLQSNNAASKCWKQLERKKRVGGICHKVDLPAVSKYEHSAGQCFYLRTRLN